MFSLVKFFGVILLCFGLLESKALNKAVDSNNLHITLLYESLCPGCRNFITYQLYDTFTKFGSDYLSLDLVPYGNVYSEYINGTTTKSCQHGPEECYGNRVHGCVLEHNSIENSLGFIHCSESSDNPVENSTFEKCANSNNISWTNIQTCLSSGEADKIFEKNGVKTDKFSPQYVPYVVFGEIFNETREDEALTNLTKVVCGLLDGNPNVC